MSTSINYLAPINNLGFGVAGSNILEELAKDNDVSLFPIGPVEPAPWHTNIVKTCRQNALFYDSRATSIRIFHQDQLAEHVGRGKRVGFPFFEIDPLKPAEVHHINQLDAVCVASKWAKDVAERSGVVIPIYVVPLGVDSRIFNENVPVERLDTDQCVFFNVGKWEVRKGHDLLVKCFNLAFSPKDRVILKFMAENPFTGQGTERWANTDPLVNGPMRSAGRLKFFQRARTQQEVASFIAAGDVGVFPARAEGWNLDLLEALRMSKPVITTNYSAHTEYITSQNAVLLEVTETEPAFDGLWFHGEGNWGKLGKRVEEQLIEGLRYYYRLHQTGQRLFNATGVTTGHAFSWENSVKKLLFAV